MTYNFDPDRWFDNEVTALEFKLNKKELTQEEYQTALDRLAGEYEKMLDRLDIQHEY